MRTCNALTRALLILPVATSLVFTCATPANADDKGTPPRAVPAARSMPRSFASYDDLVAYGTRIAADQNLLDEGYRAAQKDIGALLGQLDDVGSARVSARLDALTRAAAQLSAEGALSAPETRWTMPTGGEITQPFGPTDLFVEPARAYQGVSYAHFHDGVDIAGEWAADVVAPARGRVVFVGPMADGAEVVVIAHDGGLVSMYAHLDNYLHPPTVAAGDEVAAGQKIGTVGMTGIVTGEHLHWSVWRNGELIDPLSLIGH